MARLREAGFSKAGIVHSADLTAIFNDNVRLATATGLFPSTGCHALGRAVCKEG